MEESFTLEDIEQCEMDEIASTPNTDSITVCLCRGVCLRESGRNACPCKNCGQFCSSACHEENKICLNNPRSLLSGIKAWVHYLADGKLGNTKIVISQLLCHKRC